MKYRNLFTLLLVLLSVNSRAQQQPQIKKAAQLFAQATRTGNFKTAIRYVYPKFVAAMGGPDKMLANMNNSLGQMQSRGLVIKQLEVGEPGPVLAAGRERYSVVPERLVVQMNGSTISSTSSLLAVSPDKGKQWYFVDAGDLKEAQLKQLFPKVYDKLVIPRRNLPNP